MNIARIRLAAQHIAGNGFTTAKDLVSWMGALQAQDFNMMKWAVGIRLPGSTEKSVDGAINDGSVIRTHLMRPTWHLVSADDILDAGADSSADKKINVCAAQGSGNYRKCSEENQVITGKKSVRWKSPYP